MYLRAWHIQLISTLEIFMNGKFSLRLDGSWTSTAEQATKDNVLTLLIQTVFNLRGNDDRYTRIYRIFNAPALDAASCLTFTQSLM